MSTRKKERSAGRHEGAVRGEVPARWRRWHGQRGGHGRGPRRHKRRMRWLPEVERTVPVAKGHAGGCARCHRRKAEVVDQEAGVWMRGLRGGAREVDGFGGRASSRRHSHGDC